MLFLFTFCISDVVGDFRVYVDDLNKFKILIPQGENYGNFGSRDGLLLSDYFTCLVGQPSIKVDAFSSKGN